MVTETRSATATRSRWWEPTVALLAAAVLMSVGAGIGLPHLTEAGWSVLAVVAVAALAAGVLLLVWGVIRLVRLTRGWRRVVAVPLAVVLPLLVVYVLAIPLRVVVVPPTDVGDRTPADVGLAYEDVEVTAADGVELSAWYVPSDTGAAVVVLHGSGSTKAATLDEAAVLAGAGYAVLLLDARGHGDSSGRGNDWGWYGDADVTGAVTFLTEQPDVDPHRIAAVGLSMGGEEAVGAAAADPRLRAVVAEGATGRGAADLDWLSEVYGWRGAVTEGISWLQTRVVDLLSGTGPPTTLRDAVSQASPRPVLLVVAGEVVDEQHAADVLQGAAPASVQVWVVPGSGHTQGLVTAPEEWESRVVGFLDAATG